MLEPPAPHTLKLGHRTLERPGALIMGILNVTPDSFSDGGRFRERASAIAHARQLIAEGADLIDVGGESTRPGAAVVSVQEELDRVIPVIEGLIAEEVTTPISIDTRKAEVARAALRAGACLANDVSGGEDPGMFSVVAEAKAAIVLMHMRGTPQDMMAQTSYADVVSEVRDALAARAALARAAGIATIILDPGIGFAKTAAQSARLIRRLDVLCALGHPVLVGPSRKSFIGQLTGQPATERIEGSIAASLLAALQGARLVRVHDVLAVRRALLVFEAVRSA